MSTIDTSTWSSDTDSNENIEGIPLSADSSIAQTWQAIRILMAAFKGDTGAIQAFIVPFSGATASTDGTQGLVPAPEDGEQNKVLKGDGTWGAAPTASKLETARKLKTDLTSSTDATFDGSANQESIPVTGILPVANGGTGSNAKNFVDLTTSQSVGGEKKFTTSPKIERANPYIYFVETDQTRWTSAGASYQGIHFCDKNSENLASVLAMNYAAHTGLRLYTYSQGSTETNSNYLEIAGGNGSNKKYLAPFSTKTFSLGNSNHLFTELFCSSQTINTSDEKEKTAIASIPDDVLDAWGDVSFFCFQFNDAVAEKGASARLHSGLVSQRIDAAFRNRGLDGFRWGLLCRDQGDAVDRVEKTDDGETVNFHEDAYDNWGVRYTEALCMEAAYQRRRADRLEKRLSEIEAILSKLTSKAPESGAGE